MSCDPVLFPLKIRRNIRYGPLIITCNDTNDDPVNLSDYAAFAVGRPEIESTTLIDLEPEITDAVAGEITIDLTDEKTAAFPAGTYVWDLILVKGGADRSGPFLYGPLTVIDTVTRA